MKARNPDSDRSSNGEDETIKNGEDDWNKWSCDGHMRKMPNKKEKLRGGAGHISDGDPSLLSAKRELQEELGVKLPNDALKRYSFFCRNDQSNPICKDGKQVNAARYAYLIREQRKMLLLSYNFQAYLQLLQQSQSSSPTQRYPLPWTLSCPSQLLILFAQIQEFNIENFEVVEGENKKTRQE
ncbi:predicted protein [Arabidopsis lyrata subsp. lyrata]|uniref:Predicted protein n=1 Tax=Arabidopsis lyrata subsp. lyrata TaxID=81972 RepID=D7LMC8_ARALL|nr:predicted protein [Arabidopsis lyrata subsp. lyrata]